MAASKTTVADVLEVLRKHLDDQTINRVLTDLAAVDGNTSFKQTITTLHARFLATMKRKRKEP